MNELILTPLTWSIMVALAAIIDFFIGDPVFLYHPIILIGNLIRWLTKILNKGKHRRFKGFILWLVTIGCTILVVLLCEIILLKINHNVFLIMTTWFLSTTLAEKSLFLAGEKCERELENDNLEAARKATGEIVGRETSGLERNEIIRAVVETEAENGIDGIIAPLFYMILGIFIVPFIPVLNPLVLAFFYKAVNTLDSMVGYIYEPYARFGLISAKLDDLFNLIPARIGAFLMVLAGGLLGYDLKNGFRIFFRDRKNHLSPNSAHGEAAVAGLLRIQLGGSNTYFGHKTDKPTIGESIRELMSTDIAKTMQIVFLSEILFILLSFLILFLYYQLCYQLF